MTGYDGFKRITGTKIHVAVESNGLPISVVMSPANIHDSTKFIDVIENISEYLDDDSIEQTAFCFADKGYDSDTIREYLKNKNITPCIPKRNLKKNNQTENKNNSYNHYNKIRFVVERFFAWLKNGFHSTRIRYEKNAENYLGLINIASFLMYWSVLR